MKTKVERNGKVLALHPKVAAILIKRGVVKEMYLTRDMAAQSLSNRDALDEMDGPALHALAKERGISVHHRAGADKVRPALREAG